MDERVHLGGKATKLMLEFSRPSGETQLGHDRTDGLISLGDLLDYPGQSRSQRFLDYRPTVLADGHQPMECPLLRTTLFQLAHEQTERQHDELHVPGLALVVTQQSLCKTRVAQDGLQERTSMDPR